MAAMSGTISKRAIASGFLGIAAALALRAAVCAPRRALEPAAAT
jgi:hypothetical protein